MTHRPSRTVRSLLLVMVGALLVGGAPARADRGASIDLGRIRVTDGLLPGGGYRLPVFTVSNPGDEPTRYRIEVSAAASPSRRAAPSEWFTFEPREFTLVAGARRQVRARLSVPVGADPADYDALVAAQIVTSRSGPQVGAAAAGRIEFTVEPASLLQAIGIKIRDTVSAWMPWPLIIAAVIGATLTTAGIRRRFSITVNRRA